MKLAILQEANIDDTDFSIFHQSLAEGLQANQHQVGTFTSKAGRWQQLEYLGPFCRAFSLLKYWPEITKYTLVYGSPLTMLPFLDAPITPVVGMHSVTEALKRSLHYPDYGEESATLKRHLDDSRLAGLALDYSQEDRYRLLKEAEEAICQTNYPIIASSRNIKEELMRFYDVKPNRISILNYGVEPHWFQDVTPCPECDARFKEMNNQESMMLFYGELHRGETDFLIQGIDRLLEIFERIRGLQKLVILITDDPNYRPLFERTGAIVFENPSLEHLPHLFRHAGMFVQTARYEAQSLPLLHAMACGLPVISFPIGLSEDIIETGKNGFLVQNLIQLIAKVDFLRGNPVKAVEFGKNAAKLIRQRFILSKSISQYEKFFQDIIG